MGKICPDQEVTLTARCFCLSFPVNKKNLQTKEKGSVRNSVEIETGVVLLPLDILPSFLTLVCLFTFYTCHKAQHAYLDSLVNDTYGLILVSEQHLSLKLKKQ